MSSWSCWRQKSNTVRPELFSTGSRQSKSGFVRNPNKFLKRSRQAFSLTRIHRFSSNVPLILRVFRIHLLTFLRIGFLFLKEPTHFGSGNHHAAQFGDDL